MQAGEAILLHISSTKYQFALQDLPEINQTRVPCFQRISYEVFENTDDTYCRSCNNSDMYAYDLETNCKSLCGFKILRGFMKQYKI